MRPCGRQLTPGAGRPVRPLPSRCRGVTGAVVRESSARGSASGCGRTGRDRPGAAWQTGPVIIEVADERDFPGFLELAGQVEEWFGPMVEEPGFHDAVREHLRRGTALVAVPAPRDDGAGRDLLGGVLSDARPPAYHVDWIVVSRRARTAGVGRALLGEALRRFAGAPGTVEVVTFGADHPGAVASGARVFYERLGFLPAEAAAPGPEGGSRQVYRLARDGAGTHGTV